MKILLIHPHFPGQFHNLVTRINADTRYRVRAIGGEWNIEGTLSAPMKHSTGFSRYQASIVPNPLVAHFSAAVCRGREVGYQLARLKAQGFIPDVTLAHIGWGDALYFKDVFPDQPLLGYCEYYYRAQGTDHGFDREFSLAMGLEEVWRIRSQNAPLLLSLSAMDYGISPTPWQKSLFPPEYYQKIEVLHEGIDTEAMKPVSKIAWQLPDGRVVRSGQEIVTYAARNLEPYRGFPTFLRAAAEICRRRPQCLILIAGGDGVSYSPRLPHGQTYRERLLREVSLDPERVIFLGHLPFAQYKRFLHVSAVHVYLTVPFVLSWSLLEAMALQKVIIASNTPPVRDVIVEGQNGLLVDFFPPTKLLTELMKCLNIRTGWPILGTQPEHASRNTMTLRPVWRVT